ncbi:MAG: MBL fold metallo-hydrolase [Acidimicrobiales bacterium]
MELVEVAPRVYACLQPDEGLGYSNSGFVDRGGGLVVDTFWDLPRTRRLLAIYGTVADRPPRRLVNTHHNGDHYWGNQLFAELGTEIIGHRLCAAYLTREAGPAAFVELCEADDETLGPMAGLARALRRFDFRGIRITPPQIVIDGDTELDLDGTVARLLYVGPAHTAGDVVVHLPDEGVLFTGDILFNRCTPIGWEGTFAGWVDALDRLVALEPAVVVPGHGPLGDVGSLRAQREYLIHVRAEAERLFEQGLPPLEAAKRIELGPYVGWNEPERLVFQVHRAYRELLGEPWDAPTDIVRVFAEMAELREHLEAGGG